MVITAKTDLFIWLLAITAAASIPVTCALARARPVHPAPPEPCVDSAEILASDSRYNCAPGEHIEVYPIGADSQYPKMLVKCICLAGAQLAHKESPDAHDQDR